MMTEKMSRDLGASEAVARLYLEVDAEVAGLPVVFHDREVFALCKSTRTKRMHSPVGLASVLVTYHRTI